VIKTFKDTETEKIYHRERSRKLSADIQQVALRKLRMINNAINLHDLRVPQQIDLRNRLVTGKVNIA
jgi:toxin HigB-1